MSRSSSTKRLLPTTNLSRNMNSIDDPAWVSEQTSKSLLPTSAATKSIFTMLSGNGSTASAKGRGKVVNGGEGKKWGSKSGAGDGNGILNGKWFGVGRRRLVDEDEEIEKLDRDLEEW
ncbi:hypothetical protein HDU76_007959, partial [Blyttiomyces sp. JEL0837]